MLRRKRIYILFEYRDTLFIRIPPPIDIAKYLLILKKDVEKSRKRYFSLILPRERAVNYLLVQPEGALLPDAKSGLCEIFDTFELREDELAGAAGIEHPRLAAGNRRYGYRRLSVRRRHVAHAGLRIELTGHRQRDLRPGSPLRTRRARHLCSTIRARPSPPFLALSTSSHVTIILFDRSDRSSELGRIFSSKVTRRSVRPTLLRYERSRNAFLRPPPRLRLNPVHLRTQERRTRSLKLRAIHVGRYLRDRQITVLYAKFFATPYNFVSTRHRHFAMIIDSRRS